MQTFRARSPLRRTAGSASGASRARRHFLKAVIAVCGIAGCIDVAPFQPTTVVRNEPTAPAHPIPPPAEPTVPANPPVPSVSEILLADTSGLVIRRLTTGRSPAWSHDGGRIAFERDGDLFVIDVATLGETRITAGRSPSWAPNDNRLAFVGEEGIQTIAPDGSAPRTILRHDFRDDTYAPWDMGVGQPAWSPDGNQIAFAHLGDGDMQPGLTFVMGADGSSPRRITLSINGYTFAESNPAWSPDGLSVALWSYGYGLALTRVDDGRPRTLFLNFPLVAYGTKPAWSPTGDRILFNYGFFAGITESIWVIPTSGGPPRRLIENGHDAAWSSRAPVIAFVRGGPR